MRLNRLWCAAVALWLHYFQCNDRLIIGLNEESRALFVKLAWGGEPTPSVTVVKGVSEKNLCLGHEHIVLLVALALSVKSFIHLKVRVWIIWCSDLAFSV